MQVREDEDFTLSCYGCKEISTTMTEGSKWFLGRLVYVMRSIDYRWLHLQYEEIYKSENLKKGVKLFKAGLGNPKLVCNLISDQKALK